MTTVSGTLDVAPGFGRDERKMLLILAGCLLIALLLTPLLPDRVAADAVVRVAVLLLILMGAIDFVTLKVPNLLVYPAIAFVLTATAVIDSGSLPAALLGGGAALAIMIVLAAIQRGAMGMGDVKVACLIGCILGIKAGTFALLFGFSVAGVVALPLVLLGLRSRKDVLPLAPFLAIGALISIQIWGFLLPGNLGLAL